MVEKQMIDWECALELLEAEHKQKHGKLDPDAEYHMFFANCHLSAYKTEDGELKVHLEDTKEKTHVYMKQEVELTGLFIEKERSTDE